METDPVKAIFRIENGKTKVVQTKLIEFLESEGFINVQIGTITILARKQNNILSKSSTGEAIILLRDNLLSRDLKEEYEIFARGLTSYVSNKKLELLSVTEVIDDRDEKNLSTFYFENCYCEIAKDKIVIKDYKELNRPIWKSRIIKRNYNEPESVANGQFYCFCQRITGDKPDRLQALQCLLGYLLHRNKERGENKAGILYDEKMGVDGKANGRTGKSLLGEAISLCRDVEPFDGKSLKLESNFRNQRLTPTTDLLFFDDILKNTDFENFYSLLTKGVEVEKKGRQSFYIDQEKSPKVLMTSNHYVKGDGGDSDRARRFEFEISNYFSNDYIPEMEFGNRFFDNSWPEEEWNQFFSFMFSCVQEYFSYGLIEAPTINLPANKVADITCPEFLEFGEAYFTTDTRLDKRQLHSEFIGLYPKWKDLTTNQFTRWSHIYAHQWDYTYADKSSGGNFYCWFNTKNEDGNE